MKVSDNFELQEFVPKDVYEMFGDRALSFLDKRIIDVVQLLRDLSGRPIIINNWHNGGKFSESGYRTPNTKTGARYSQHKFGRAADVKVTDMSPKDVVELIKKNEALFMAAGLTTIENVEHTPTWTHLDCRWTNSKKILFVNP